MKVTFISQLHYFNSNLPSRIEGYEIEKIDLNFKTIDKLRGLSSDIIVFFRPDFIGAEIIRTMKGKKVWISTEPIEREDVLRSHLKLAIAYREWDLICHYDSTHLPVLKQNMIAAIEFQLPVNLSILERYDSPFPYSEPHHDFDIFFSGRSTHHREFLTRNLKRDYRFLHAAHGLIDHDFCTFVNRSAICLNLNINDFAQLQPRKQMLLACGAFVLSEKQTHYDSLKPCEHYIEFSGEADLIDKVQYYLQHTEARERIAEQGMSYVQQNFDANKKWAELLNIIA